MIKIIRSNLTSIILAFGLCVPALMLVGCGKSNGNSATAQTTNATPTTQASNVVDGYKSFKFGMKPSEIAKLPECAGTDYDEGLKMSLAHAETKLADFLTDWKSNPNHKGEFPTAENDSWEDNVTNYKEYKADVEFNKGNNEERLARLLHCTINFTGLDIVMSKNIRDAKYIAEQSYSAKQVELMTLSSMFFGKGIIEFNKEIKLQEMAFPAGDFIQEKLDSLIKALNDKYTLSSSPSDVDVATVNSKANSSASWFFENNSVQLMVVSANDSSKHMFLIYHDAKSTQAELDLNKIGKAGSSDL